MKNIWSERIASQMDELDKLVYQSRLVGAEPSLVLWGGGNTSLKTTEKNFMGDECRVLRVKGSGTDMKSIQRDGFPGVALEYVLPLLDRRDMSDQEMVDYLNHCLAEPNSPRPSIETLLHAFIPYASVVHSHADAILSLTNTQRARVLLSQAFGKAAVAVSYRRPGFLLSKEIALSLQNNPDAKCVVLINHGLVTWGPTPKAAYDSHIKIVSQAEEFLATHSSNAKDRKIFVPGPSKGLSYSERSVVAASISATIRGLISNRQRAILRFEDGDDVMEFVNASDLMDLTSSGAATPDHLLNTKHLPLVVELDNPDDTNLTFENLTHGISRYAERYEQWFSRYTDGQHPMADPYPRVILIPQVGMWTAGKDGQSAKVTADIYRHTIKILAGSHAIDHYKSLSAKEAFRAEYWPLELYKRSIAPPEKELSRRIVMVTGAASGIGKATAIRLAQEGAHVVITDVRVAELKALAQHMSAQYGIERILYLKMDVSKERDIQAAFKATLLAFGGLDILISNAGIAHTSPIDKLTLSAWQESLSINATGHFLVAREAIDLLKQQGLGGSMVFIATKNVTAPGQDFGAYSAAKAAEAQLARVIAIENGKYGIRSNMVNPDGVFRDSKLWSQHIREERAQAHGIQVDQVEEFYRDRNLLKTSVTAEDVAETVLFLAGDRSLKTTGSMIPVDGGVREAFPR